MNHTSFSDLNTYTDFHSIMEIIGIHEGGFQNHHNDRGNWTSGIVGVGENKGTKGGITAMTYPLLDIENLTDDEILRLYKRDFWDKYKVHKMPSKYRLLFMDMTVNHGFYYASKMFQKAVNKYGGTLKEDGLFGNKSRVQLEVYEPILDSIRIMRVAFIRNGQKKGIIPKWYGLIDRAYEV